MRATMSTATPTAARMSGWLLLRSSRDRSRGKLSIRGGFSQAGRVGSRRAIATVWGMVGLVLAAGGVTGVKVRRGAPSKPHRPEPGSEECGPAGVASAGVVRPRPARNAGAPAAVAAVAAAASSAS